MNEIATPSIPPPSIMEYVKSLNLADEDSISFIVAGTFNLYAESRRRIHGEMLMTPNDIKAIFQIVDLLLTQRDMQNNLPQGRSRKLSEEENANLLGAVQADISRRR